MPVVGIKRAVGVALAPALAVAACSKPRPPAPPQTVDQMAAAAADTLLACLGGGSDGCAPVSPASEGWIAQGYLETIAWLPAALVPEAMLDAADDHRDPRIVDGRIATEIATAQERARDLSCRTAAVEPGGEAIAQRRAELVALATRMGVAGTAARPALTELAEASARLDRARLVTARCHGGDVYVLVVPPAHPIAPDEDPAAYAAGGWEAILASSDRAAVLLGGVPPLPAEAPPIEDAAAEGMIDPWLPIPEVEL